MTEILNTIAPVFMVILLGWALKQRGLIDEPFAVHANRLVFYIGVPSLIFREIAGADFKVNFNASSILLTLASVCLIYLLVWFITLNLDPATGTRGTFLQGSIHGNISYVGLAIVLYSLGEKGLGKAGVLSGFLILLNNSLSFLSLHFYGRPGGKAPGLTGLARIPLNPIVAGSALGLLVSLFSLPLPIFLDRSLKILGSMALPTALLVMGAGISFREMADDFPLASRMALFKLIALPGIGWVLFSLFSVPPDFALPSLILLASPSAALTYIMAREMGGNVRLASSAVGLTTLSSSVTYIIWLKAFG